MFIDDESPQSSQSRTEVENGCLALCREKVRPAWRPSGWMTAAERVATVVMESTRAPQHVGLHFRLSNPSTKSLDTRRSSRRGFEQNRACVGRRVPLNVSGRKRSSTTKETGRQKLDFRAPDEAFRDRSRGRVRTRGQCTFRNGMTHQVFR